MKKRILAIVTCMTLVAMVAPSVSAVTIDELMAQIAALQAQLVILQGQVSTPAVTSFTTNLSFGMRGAAVTNLQNFLISKGHLAAGLNTGYFGPLTKAAVMAYQTAKSITPVAGYFGPLTRAAANADGGIVPTTSPTPSPAAGVTVALSALTPAAAVVPSSATGVEFAKFAFSTDSGTATISSLVIHRYGVGSAAELTNIYLYDGDTRLTGARSVNSDTQNVTFSNLSVAVSPTSKVLTVKVDTAAASSGVHGFEIASATAVTTTGTTAISGIFPVRANSMTLSTSAAGTATVAETTAALSAYLGESGAEVAKFRITAGTRDILVKGITLTQGGTLGNSYLTKFVLKYGATEVATATAIGSNDRLVLTFNSAYGIDAGVAKTFSLYADIIGGKTTDDIKFYVEETTDVNILDEVYQVGAGITNSWALSDQTVDILGSTITLGNNGPITGSVASNSISVPILNYSVTADRNVTVKISTVKIEAKYGSAIPDVEATLTASAADAVASSAVSSTVNTEITMDADVAAYDNWQAGSMLKLTDNSGAVTYAIVISTDTDLSDGGLIVTGLHSLGNTSEVEEVNPFDYIKNVKLVNLTSGGTILGPTSLASSMTKSNVSNTYYSKAYTDSYDLAANTTTKFSIQVDVDGLMPAGYSIYATIVYSATNSMKDVGANEYISATDIVPNTLASNAQTVTNSSLAVLKTATPVSNSFVIGQQDLPALGIALAAGSAKEVKVNKIVLRLYADADGTFDSSGLGGIAANTLVNSVTLVNSLTGATYGPANLVLVDTSGGTYTTGVDYYKATFSNMGLTVAKNGNVGFVAKLNLKTAVSGTNYLAVDLMPAIDVEAEDDTGTIVPAGATNLNLLATPIPKITVTATGSLTVTVDAGTPEAAILVASGNATTPTNVTKYKLHAVNEAFIVTGLGLAEENGSGGGYDDDFTSVQITYPKNAAGDLETQVSGLIGGYTVFAEDSIGIYVPKNGDAYLTIKVTTNSIDDGADSGENPKIDLTVSGGYLTDSFIAVGQASGTKLYGATNTIALVNTNVKEMVVRKTKPTIAKAAASTALSNGENILYAFTVAADANENVSFKRVVFSSAISDAATANITVGYYTFYRGSTPLTADVTITDQISNNLTGVVTSPVSIATTNVIVTFTGTKEEVVAKGTSNTYYLKATVGVSAVGDSITFRIANDITNLGSTVVTAANFGVAHANDTAAWSTTKSVGAYSAALTKTADLAGSTYVQFVPTPGITLADLATVGDSSTWSFLHLEGATTTTNWVQLELRFTAPTNTDPDGAGHVDVTLMPLQNTAGSITWVTKSVLKTSGRAEFYGNMLVGGAAFSDQTVGLTLANLPALIETADTTTTATGAWQLTRVRFELWEAIARTTYIDNVVIAGVTYAVEPANLIWSDNSVVAHTVYTADWANGYLVADLPVAPLTLSR
jgi:hypothetical protein